jgi:iron complex outermembrane receptor protein
MKLKPLALLIALPPCLVNAADVPLLEEILVTATRPEQQVLGATRIGNAELAPMRASTSDTANLLRDIPGVSLYGAGGVSSLPVIHGLADDRLRIKLDGMDLIAACPNHMNPALSYIDPSSVETLKVYAGVTPVSVGGDSIGGSIVVESAKPRFAGAGGEMLKEGEIGGFFRGNGDAHGLNAKVTLAGENLSVSYSGAKAESGNYKAAENFKDALFGNPANSPFTGRAGHTLALDEVGSTAYETSNQSLDIAWRNGKHLVAFTYAHQDIPFENFVNQRMDMTANESDKFNLGYEGQFGWGVLKARAYRENTDHEMDFGVDKRYWYGPGPAPTGAGGNTAINPLPCSPISGTTGVAPNQVGCAAGMPMYTASKTDGLNINGEVTLSERDTLRVGAEYQSYTLDDWWPESGAGMWGGDAIIGNDAFWNINNGERDRYALFGEWEAKHSPQWTSLFGVRHETVRMDAGDVRGYNIAAASTSVDAAAFNASDRGKTDHNWDLTALARFKPSESQTWEFGLAQKTRSPSLYERYTWSSWQMAALMNNFVGDGNGYFGNVDLKPEVAHTLSVTADWHDAGKKWGIKATPYYTRVKDYIDAVQWDTVTGSASATNLTDRYTVLRHANQSARLYGIDISGFALIASNTGYGDFSVSGLVNYVDGENRETGDNLYNIMPLNGKLALTQKWGKWTNTVEGVFVAGKDKVSAVRNEIETSGYSLFNLRSSYEWKQVRLDVGIENLFDKAYDLPLGGAYVGQGTTMTTATAATGVVPLWGTAVPGMGRSIYAGLKVKF